MRPVLNLVGLAVALSIVALHPAAAQGSGSAPGADSARGRGNAADAKPALSATEKEATAARTRNEAKERGWDDRMKRTMRSICSGATGC